MKKTNKKKVTEVKSAAKVAVKKTKVFMKKAGNKAVKNTKILAKKAGKEAGKMAKVLQKKWKKAEPAREQYKKEAKEAVEKAGARGMELLKSGLKNSIKIGEDIADVIKKDINKMREDDK